MNLIRHWTVSLAAAAVLILAGCSSFRMANERAVSMDDVIRMSQAGVDKDVIVRQLESTYSQFRLTPDDIVCLTEAGVDSEIIKSMIDSGAAPGPFSWEYGWTSYDNWVDYNDFVGFYGGYRYHYPYYPVVSPYGYMYPYISYQEPGLVGRFYHYAPVGGRSRPYFDYNHRRDRDTSDNSDDSGEQGKREER